MRRMFVMLAVGSLLLSSAGGGELYWTDNTPTELGQIKRTDTDTLTTTTLISGLTHVVYRLAVDEAGGTMYWTNVSQSDVYRANLDGSGVERIFDRPSGSTRGVAVDPASGNLFFLYRDEVWRSDLDGGNAALLIDNLFAQDIVLDAVAGAMYLSRFDGSGSGSVVKAGFDGSGLTTLVGGIADGPVGMTLSAARNEIFWGTYNFTDNTGAVQRADLDDGGGVATLYSGAATDALAFDPIGEKLYWTSWPEDPAAGDIARADADGGNFELPGFGATYPGGLAFIPEPGGLALLLLGGAALVARRRSGG